VYRRNSDLDSQLAFSAQVLETEVNVLDQRRSMKQTSSICSPSSTLSVNKSGSTNNHIPPNTRISTKAAVTEFVPLDTQAVRHVFEGVERVAVSVVRKGKRAFTGDDVRLDIENGFICHVEYGNADSSLNLLYHLWFYSALMNINESSLCRYSCR
jgi:hypothetical protein